MRTLTPAWAAIDFASSRTDPALARAHKISEIPASSWAPRVVLPALQLVDRRSTRPPPQTSRHRDVAEPMPAMIGPQAPSPVPAPVAPPRSSWSPGTTMRRLPHPQLGNSGGALWGPARPLPLSFGFYGRAGVIHFSRAKKIRFPLLLPIISVSIPLYHFSPIPSSSIPPSPSALSSSLISCNLYPHLHNQDAGFASLPSCKCRISLADPRARLGSRREPRATAADSHPISFPELPPSQPARPLSPGLLWPTDSLAMSPRPPRVRARCRAP